MLKNRRIALLIDEPELRTELYMLLVRAGAAVYCADSDEEFAMLVNHLDVEIAVIGDSPQCWPSPN